MTDSIVVEQDEVVDIEGEELVSLEDINVDEIIDDNSDALEAEVDSKLPDKFKGKTIEEVADSYSNLEKEFGRKNNELGEQRKLIDQLLELKLEEKNSTSDKQDDKAQKVDVDSLLEDPDTVISDAVANNPLLKEMQDNLDASKRERELASFEDVHPDWQTVVGSDEFAKWVTESPVRTQLYNDANKNYKYDVAAELLTLYKGVQQAVVEGAKETKSQNAKRAMKDAVTEKGATGASTTKVYSRKQLMQLRLRDPAKYESMSDIIYKAYAEGRVR